MVLALLAGAVEGLYLLRQDSVSFVEQYALVFVGIGLSAALFILMKFPGEYIDRLALVVFVIAVVYISAMLISALFLGQDKARSLHAILWFHPAFVAVTLTQPMKIAQSACWLVILFLTGVMVYFGGHYEGALLQSTLVTNIWIVLLSLCASTALLFSLSVYRESQGASAARVEILEKYSAALQAEAEAKDKMNGELEQANAVVASFLDNMSHELRTPLNAIIGFSELIHSEMFGALANEKYKEYAGDILGSGHSLLETVNNLLYFSKLSAGKISLAPEPLDAKDIITRVADNQRPMAENAQVSIVTEVTGRPVIEADPHGITRILNGLVDNAIKFSNPGGKVYLQARQRTDGACEITIRDTGGGIAEAELEKIFAPFRKGKDSEMQAVPGVGLGLATAKMLMDLQGGTISIDSQEGEGACVTLVFYAHPHSNVLAKTG
jgi:signal transduction histidine kinase